MSGSVQINPFDTGQSCRFMKYLILIRIIPFDISFVSESVFVITGPIQEDLSGLSHFQLKSGQNRGTKSQLTIIHHE